MKIDDDKPILKTVKRKYRSGEEALDKKILFEDHNQNYPEEIINELEEEITELKQNNAEGIINELEQENIELKQNNPEDILNELEHRTIEPKQNIDKEEEIDLNNNELNVNII